MRSASCGRYLLLLLFLCCAVILRTGPIAAQDEDDGAAARHGPDIAALCDDLELELSAGVERDDDAILWILDTFANHYSRSEAQDRKKIIAGVKKILGKPPSVDLRRIQADAIKCLTRMDKKGMQTLQALVKKIRVPKKKKDNEEEIFLYVRHKADLIKALGSFADPRTLKVFYEALEAKESEIINAACQALECFHELPLAQRKPIVEKLIKKYVSVSGTGQESGRKAWEQGRRHGRKLSDERHYEVAPSITSALEKLTGQSHFHATTWHTWWQAHKKDRKWD